MEKYLRINGEKVDLFEVDKSGFNRKSIEIYDIGDEIKSKKIKILLSPGKVMTKVLDLPIKSKKRVKGIIENSIIRKLPLSRNSISYSYYMEREKKRLKVLLFITKKDMIKNVLEKLEKNSIKLQEYIPMSFLYYLWHRDDQEGLYVDKIEDMTFLTYNQKGNLYLRSFLAGDIEFEIERTQKYLLNTFKLEDPPVLYRNEASKNRKSLDKKYFEKIRKVQNEIGNLKSREVNKKRHEKLQRIYGYVAVILLVVLLFQAGNNFYRKRKMESEELVNLNSVIQKMKPYEEEIDLVKIKYAERKEKLAMYEEQIKTLDRNYMIYIGKLNEVLPGDATITHLNIKGSKIVLLSGKADSATPVLKALGDSNYFRDINLIGSVVSRDGKESFRIEGVLDDEKSE